MALTSGRAGAPCACFGARGRVGRASLARAAALTVAFAVLPLLDRREPSTEGWLGIGLVAALLGIAALGVAVLALARELASLRAEIDPRGALEIPEEGPELGGRTELMEVEPGRLGARRLHLRGLRDVPRARARDRGARPRPARAR